MVEKLGDFIEQGLFAHTLQPWVTQQSETYYHIYAHVLNGSTYACHTGCYVSCEFDKAQQ